MQRCSGAAVFKPFVEVLAIDSTLIRLHDALAEAYPSVWTNHTKASAKIGMVTNVVGRGPRTLTITYGSRHDVHLLRPGRWLRGRLLVFDLGFFKAPLFDSIRKNQGYFLSRTRKHGNPVIVRSHRPEHQHLVGLKLRDAQDAAAFEMLDVDAEMGFIDKADRFRHHRLTFRFVAVYNERARQWHRYVTNAPPSMLAAEHFTGVYAARWEIELLFRELKTHYRLDHMPSGNRFISESLLYAAVLTLVVSRRLSRLVRRRDRLADDRTPFDRWARLIASISQQLLELALLPRRRRLTERRLLAYLKAEAPDPNRTRLPLGARAQQGLYLPA